MIVVDSSVWIAYFRNQSGRAVDALRALPDPNKILIGDLVLLECLRGARDEHHAAQLEAGLRRFVVDAMVGTEMAVETARNFRKLRGLGVTPRKAIDLIVATFCIARGYELLHQDRDFEPMVQHLGLRVVV